jgi:septin family protein
LWIQVLKTHTKEVLYEKYRTEKLLARRATRNISDDERQRLLEGALIFLYIYS